MEGVERRSLLMTGMSLGELLLVCLLIGLMLTEAIRGMQAVLQRVSQTEVLSLVAMDKIHWIETWANDGIQPPDSTASYLPGLDGRYVIPLGSEAGYGTASFAFTSKMAPLEGELLTFRPAFPADSQHVVVWVCGLAPTPRGFVVRGENLTSLPPTQLLSTCRPPLT